MKKTCVITEIRNTVNTAGIIENGGGVKFLSFFLPFNV